MQSVNQIPNYSVVKILRPFNGFRSVNEGSFPDAAPIALPGELDPAAGENGYAPNLMGAAPVALGSRVILWLPRFLNGYGQETPSYQYRLIWRLRSQVELQGSAGRTLNPHFGPQRQGVPDAGSSDAPRFIVPAAIETVQFAADQRGYDDGLGGIAIAKKGTPGLTPSGSTPDDPTNVNIASAQYKPLSTGSPTGSPNQSNYWVAPLARTYTGARFQNVDIASQGVYDNLVGGGPVDAGYFGGPSFAPFTTLAKGDELIVLVSRDRALGGVETPWEFAGADQGLGDFLSENPGLGIYLISGT